ncbi:MAG: 30S ribosomal protein S16 [Sphingobacteriia bacterium]|nr:30S ribosomal protein S16 [Sphingobacteriia bacterium]
MSVKLRLRRQGRKGHPYFHIVAADARSPRDGKFIETVGSYDATRIPAEIRIDHEVALKWLRQGAQPTDTVSAILKYTGINFKHHLLKKGVSPEEVQLAYEKWAKESQDRIEAKKKGLTDNKAAALQAQREQEARQRKEKAEKIIIKNTPPPVEVPVAEAETPAEVVEETPTAATENSAE